MYSYGPPHMAGQKRDDQLEHTSNSYVRIRDVAPKTCQRRCTIGRSSKRGSGISVPVAHDNDNLLTEVVQSNKYYKSRAVVVTYLRNTTSFILPRYQKSRGTGHNTTITKDLQESCAFSFNNWTYTLDFFLGGVYLYFKNITFLFF